MKRRYTIETLKSGQARAYGPTVYRYRILYEHVWPIVGGIWEQARVIEVETVMQDARHYGGWTDPIPGDAMTNHFRTKLVYIIMIEPGLWEWETSQAYCD